MATSPNFGWLEPDNTDLVKNGALAIRTAVDAIDTSMGDLLGGTTGQVLTKATDTDMDFTWSAGASVPTSYGFAAGKNAIINGDFRINQRSFTSNTASGSYNFDRFAQTNGGTSGTLTVTPQTFTPGTAPVTGYEAINFVRYVTAAGADANTYALLNQKIEDVRTFANQTVTVSFWAKTTSGTPKVSVELEQACGSGGSGSFFTASSTTATLSTSWTRYSFTITLPSLSGKTIGTSSYLNFVIWLSAGSTFNTRANSIGLQNATFDFWGLQIEAGSVATAFQTATGTIQGELAACQRYYNRFTAPQAYSHFAQGWAINTDNAIVFFNLPVEMRTVPTAIDYASVNMGDSVNPQITPSTITFTADNNNTKAIGCTGTKSAGGMTQYRNYQFLAAGTTAAYIGFSAEL